MRRSTSVTLVCGLFLLSSLPAAAQSTPNPAMNTPDQLAWQFFIQVNSRAGGNNALFETWASDTDTFKPIPQFPTTATPLALRQPAVLRSAGRRCKGPAGCFPPFRPVRLPRGIAAQQGVVRLHRGEQPVQGIRPARRVRQDHCISGRRDGGQGELEAGDRYSSFSGGRVTLADVPKLYHVNTGSDGKQYAFVSMHIISKAVPNWTWATFEHQFNPARCDIIGCRDLFGAQTSPVQPNPARSRAIPIASRRRRLPR